MVLLSEEQMEQHERRVVTNGERSHADDDGEYRTVQGETDQGLDILGASNPANRKHCILEADEASSSSTLSTLSSLSTPALSIMESWGGR